jgi:hypothetical protein
VYFLAPPDFVNRDENFNIERLEIQAEKSSHSRLALPGQKVHLIGIAIFLETPITSEA